MRILLDSKDVMDLIERGIPAPVNEIREIFTQRGWSLVLSTVNVGEFAASLAETQDFLSMRSWLQTIETFPLAYIRNAFIEMLEVIEAQKAFAAGHEPAAIDPFASRWDEAMVPFGRPPRTEHIVNYRLHDMVFSLARDDALNLARFKESARRELMADRTARETKRIPERQRFARLVAARMRVIGYGPPDETIRVALSRWMSEDPHRCPGTWFHHHAHEELIRNVTDGPQHGDLPDLGHMTCVPYVERVTFDRRMSGYATGAVRRLAKHVPEIDLQGRVFRSLAAVLAAV